MWPAATVGGMDGQQWATWLGIALTAGLGVWGLLQSRRANRHAGDAAQAAREAGERAERAERMQLESRDVRWEYEYDDKAALLSLRNVGTDVAYEPLLVVDAEDDGGRLDARQQRLAPHESLAVDLREHKIRADQVWKDLLEAGALAVPSIVVRIVMTWRSESGVPDRKIWERVSL